MTRLCRHGDDAHYWDTRTGDSAPAPATECYTPEAACPKHRTVTIQYEIIVRGMDTAVRERTFPNQAALERWVDKQGDRLVTILRYCYPNVTVVQCPTERQLRDTWGHK